MKSYNYKNCKSLFGYSAEVHIRCGGECQLCGCGSPLNFDLWRQMTVEHLIGKSQGGYLKQIRETTTIIFPNHSKLEIDILAKKIDSLNTVTTCQFCNSTTSRDVSSISMTALLNNTDGDIEQLLSSIESACSSILESKRKTVKWKIEAVEKAFKELVSPKILSENI